jgi:hypothetical protein
MLFLIPIEGKEPYVPPLYPILNIEFYANEKVVLDKKLLPNMIMNMNIVSGIRRRSGKSCAAQLQGAEKKPMIRPAIVQDAGDFSSS